MIITTFLLYIFGLIFLIEPTLCTVSVDDSNTILISNGFVTCYSDHLVIHFYYFPFGDKTIKYKNIRSCELLSSNDLNFFETKSWGMAFSNIWWHLDIRRQWRSHYIVLNANQWPKIGVTMNDDDTITVYNIIKKKMII
ncbi:unnamed protein product [Adineta steineri]|uniref:Uncharacterized protein n=1 Tax=Adineta steineri TaxID=433720 RepID=A0A815GU65_9BILA|nr:unnamed protein product [Adineta steineri]CAF3485116.1 unnamed protein product [Adineta steineri]